MALPNMPSLYTARKNIFETAIVGRRNRENDFRQTWDKNAEFFHKSDIEAAKKKNWESNVSFQNSMDAWKTQKTGEEKKRQLDCRRSKLAQMLREEREQHTCELRGLSPSNSVRMTLEEMRDKSEGLRSAREEKRQQVAEQKMYEHWRVNNPDLRQIESAHHQQHVVSRWSEQVSEHEQAALDEKRRREEEEAGMERDRLAALEAEQQVQQRRVHDERVVKRVLQAQIHELKDREAEARELKQQQEQLLREQWALQDAEEERKQMEAERKKLEFGHVLLRQHAAALRRKSRLIQEELEADLKLLTRVRSEEKGEREVQTARREKAKQDADWMRQVLQEQLKVEKTREAELDMLYQDEAARVWQQREQEWQKERGARERLMKEVMDARQQQVQQRMQENREQQQQSIEQREELVRKMEHANQLTRREMQDDEQSKTARKQELMSQMSARDTVRRAAHEDLRLQLDEDRQAEENYEEMLRQEAAQLNLQGFKPKDHGRRQAWM